LILINEQNRFFGNAYSVANFDAPIMSPISLSDDQLTIVTQFAEPLAPPDRLAFLAALANLLQHEPRPVGDGAVHRAAKQLLASGHYKLNTAVTTGAMCSPRPCSPRF
jgi:hypothetical protein